jgi:hypothetical protein
MVTLLDLDLGEEPHWPDWFADLQKQDGSSDHGGAAR